MELVRWAIAWPACDAARKELAPLSIRNAVSSEYTPPVEASSMVLGPIGCPTCKRPVHCNRKNR